MCEMTTLYTMKTDYHDAKRCWKEYNGLKICNVLSPKCLKIYLVNDHRRVFMNIGYYLYSSNVAEY